MAQHMNTLGSERVRNAIIFLHTKIVSGSWQLNQRIPTEPELAEILGVGRSTVREAVRALANVGMLETAAGRGTFVRSKSPMSGILTEFVSQHSLSDIKAILMGFEVQAAQLAAVKRSDEDLVTLKQAIDQHGDDPSGEGDSGFAFQFAMLKASGNTLLGELYQVILAGMRLGHAETPISSDELQDKRTMLQELYDAIEARDEKNAAHAAVDYANQELFIKYGTVKK